jgi:hypothetical protein
MEREVLATAIDSIDQPRGIERGAARGLVDHRGLAKPPGKVAELAQLGGKTAKQQSTVLAVVRHNSLAVEIGQGALAIGLDHHEGLTGTGEMILGHDVPVIAQVAWLGYALAMTEPLAQLLATPDAYLHSLEGGEAVLVPMDRAAYRRSIFLDHRISPAGEGGWRVPVAELAGAAPPVQPMGWIFHVAHCGSTLLARALDELGGALVLREPLALRQLALQGDRSLLPAVLAMLSRRYPGEGASLVKANVPVNFMLDAIAAADPQAPAILLWSRLDDYLTAILRSPNHRAWVRNVTGLLSDKLGAELPESDAELAALLWTAQMREYARAIGMMPHAVSLEAETFFSQPAETLHAAAAHFGVLPAPGAVEDLVAGPLFNTYSKSPAQAFDNAARIGRNLALATSLASDLDVAQSWVETNAADIKSTMATVTSKALTT